MRRTSLVQAKAHLSEIVDSAELKGRPTLICRHGKPAAAVVPVEVATKALGKPSRPRLTPEQAVALLDELARSGDAAGSALEDLRESRSRLDSPSRTQR